MNRYRVVRDVLGKQEEVVVEADSYDSGVLEGKIFFGFYKVCTQYENAKEKDPELIATFWGESVAVVKLPEEA